MSQGSLKLTLGRTRLMGPSEDGATPLDLLFDSDSAAVSDSFIDISMLRTNLKVIQNGLERARNLLSNKKKNHPIRSPYEKVVGVLSQVCLCSSNLNPERERLGLYLLLAQK